MHMLNDVDIHVFTPIKKILGIIGNDIKCKPVNLPWIFPGSPLEVNVAPGNIQGDLTGMRIQIVKHLREARAQLN